MKLLYWIILFISFDAFAQTQNYTLLFSRGQSLQQSRESALIASGIVPYKCFVANQVGNFIVRCGDTNKSTLLNWQVLMKKYDIETEIAPYSEGADVVLFEYNPITLSETTQEYLIEIAAKQLNFSFKKNKHHQTEILDVQWDKEQVRQGLYFIDRGWAAYNSKEFILSENLFSLAHKVAILQNTALYGQALSNIELNKLKLSLGQLKKLYLEKFNLKDVLPSLLAVAEKLQDHKTVTEILPKLTQEQKEVWQQTLLKIEFSRLANQKNLNTSDLDSVGKYQVFLTNCLAIDIWFKLIKRAEKLNYKKSLDWIKTLINSCKSQTELIALAYPGTRIAYKHFGIDITNNFILALNSKITHQKLRNKLDKLRFDMLMKAANEEKEIQKKKAIYKKIIAYWPGNQNGRQAAGWLFYELKEFNKAYEMFLPNWQRFGNKKAIEGMVYTLIAQNKTNKALNLAKNNHQEDLYLMALKKVLSEEEIPSLKSYETALKVHVLEANYQPALAALAWYLFDKKDYLKAKAYFEHWYSLNSLDITIAQGLLDSMVNLGMMEAALTMAKKIDGVEFQLQPKVLSETAFVSFSEKNYQQTIKILDQIRKKQILTESEQTILAWSQFHIGQFERSNIEFETLFLQYDKEDYLQGVILSLERLDDRAALNALYESLENNNKYKTHTAKNDYQKGRWLKASLNDPDNKIYGALHKPFIWYDLDWNFKKGDSGTSEMRLLSQQIGFSYSFSLKHQINLMLNSYKSDAGLRKEDPFYGSNYLDVPVVPTTTKVSEIWPAIEYLYQGKNHISINLAKAALINEMDKKYWGSIHWRGVKWQVKAYKDGIKESQLSLHGQQDPYSGAFFGGVYKKGIKVGYKFLIDKEWTGNVSTHFEHIRGQNVINNQDYAFNFSASRAFKFDLTKVNSGFFAQWQSYNKNSNSYQFGHGGYFSPQTMGIIGFFARIHNYNDKDWWFVDLAVSYFNWETEDIALYPLNSRFERVLKDKKDAFGGGISAEKHWLFSKHWELGLAGQYNISPGYKHMKFGLTLRYLFGKRNNLWPRNQILETQNNIKSYNTWLVEK